jgi:hypothetical protein
MQSALNQDERPAFSDTRLRLLIERIDWRLDEALPGDADLNLFRQASDALTKYAELRTRLCAVLRLD